MSEKTKKFEDQLNDLISKGDKFSMAITHEFRDDRAKTRFEEELGKEGYKELFDKLPNFREEYQSWYSISLALVKQVLPDRLKDFLSYYEYPRVRKDITYENYVIRDYLQNLRVTRGDRIIVDGSAAIHKLTQQLNIVRAAKEALESTLIDLTSILQADLFDSEIDSARALAKSGFLRAAGAICGVVIEKHLKHICDIHMIVFTKKRLVIADFNDKLKDGEIISVPQWRFMQHLSDIRNLCDHAREREPSRAEVDDLISGTEKVLKTVF